MDSSTPRPEEIVTGGADQNEAGTKKRRPTEKRKLQNRIAQRKYRKSYLFDYEKLTLRLTRRELEEST